MGVGRGANNPTLQQRKLLRSLQKIQPGFVEEPKAGLWNQGKKKEVNNLMLSSFKRMTKNFQ
jgi:hypothetical protein